jgi:Domain of unknown function (DUF4396)
MNLLELISKFSVLMAILCSIMIIIDILNGNHQHMMIMNFVWPITALYAGPLGILAHYTIGRKSTHKKMMAAKKYGGHMSPKQRPFWQSVAVGTLHCRSGCTLGDIIAEIFLLIVPVVLFGSKIFGSWATDFVFAFFIGIIFQYYSIKPMKKLSAGQGLIAALKADNLSLTSWQVGMYGSMAIAFFVVFKKDLGLQIYSFGL